jgi:beta-phosphoglucomutase-like phosphatase (HAD superfamily)
MSWSSRRTLNRGNHCNALLFIHLSNYLPSINSPDPYLLGAKKCGVKAENCEPSASQDECRTDICAGVVFEDAPTGVRSGQAAGSKTIGFLTSHSRQQMEAVKPDFLVQDMSWYLP